MKLGLGLGLRSYQYVSSGPSYDPDAQAFFTAAGITNTTQKDAINFRVLSLKGTDISYNPSGLDIWSKISRDLPFVGGSATSHKYDLKTAGICVTWAGGVTHDANGITGNGTNAYGLMDVSPTDLGQNTGGFSIYSRNTAAIDHRAFGIYQTGPTSHFYIYPRYSDNNTYQGLNAGEQSEANSDGSGNFIMTRQNATTYNVFIRGSKTAKTSISNTPSVRSIVLLAAYIEAVIGDYSTINLASATAFNLSLTDGEAAAMKAIDTQFQTLLSRNI